MSRPRRRAHRSLINLSSTGAQGGTHSRVPRLVLLFLVGTGATLLLILALLGVRW